MSNLVEVIKDEKTLDEFVNSLTFDDLTKYYVVCNQISKKLEPKLKQNIFKNLPDKLSYDVVINGIAFSVVMSKGTTKPGTEPVIEINEPKLIEWAKTRNIQLPYKLDIEKLKEQDWYLANQSDFCNIKSPKEITTYNKIIIKEKK